jgi:hypothetical protein
MGWRAFAGLRVPWFNEAKAREAQSQPQGLGTVIANRRVVMLATRGLVPGDLDARSPSPPVFSRRSSVAHVQGDGVLTMSKILGLKLDADWAALSSCNTGDGAGAEAVSSSGRAFFYAITALSWPLAITPARTFTTGLLRHQSLSREAPHEAELALHR